MLLLKNIKHIILKMKMDGLKLIVGIWLIEPGRGCWKTGKEGRRWRAAVVESGGLAGVAHGSSGVNKYIQTTWRNNLLKEPVQPSKFRLLLIQRPFLVLGDGPWIFKTKKKKEKKKRMKEIWNQKEEERRRRRKKETPRPTSSTYSDTLCLIYMHCIIPCSTEANINCHFGR